jgi:hypothetical protein
MTRIVPPITALLLLAATAQAGPSDLDGASFERLHRLLLPQPGESRWADLPWLTSLPEARKRAVELDRPLFVWRAGGGEVLGRA